MAGAKSFAVYNLDASGDFFETALELLTKYPDCGSDLQVAELLVDYAYYLNMSLRLKETTKTVERLMLRIERLGDCQEAAIVYHHYIYALFLDGRYREATIARDHLLEMADRLHDSKSTAYALASALNLSIYVSPYSIEHFEELRRKALEAASNVNDPYIYYLLKILVGFDEIHRGRTLKARQAADEAMALGRKLNDPRAIGFGMWINAMAALAGDDIEAAINFAEAAMSFALTPFDYSVPRAPS